MTARNFERAPSPVGFADSKLFVENRLWIRCRPDVVFFATRSRAPVSRIGWSATPTGCGVTLESTHERSFSFTSNVICR
jgi:hypothetical protein